MKNKKFENLGGEIDRIKIPDEDASNWIKALEEGGFSYDEIDKIMTHLNRTWRMAKKPELVKERMDEIIKNAWAKDKLILNDEEKEELKRKIEAELEK